MKDRTTCRMNPPIESLERNAKEMRVEIARILEKTSGSHIGSDYSVLDILNVLYFKILKIDPERPFLAERDRLILSKGHACLALYTILAKRGFFSKETLNSYLQNGSPLVGHVDSRNVPGVEVSTGSLGHGLAIGIGMALANKQDRNKGRAFVILGDGECNEGSIWESAILANRLKLDSLIVVVDANRLQGIDNTKEIFGDAKLINLWKATGFGFEEIDGHDYHELLESFQNLPIKEGRPSVIYANTVKGKGVSFMENKLEWHYKSPNKEQLRIIEEELR